MAHTLKQGIQARITDLSNQIAQLSSDCEIAIAPLRRQIREEEDKLGRFAPWLNDEVSSARSLVAAILAAYAPEPGPPGPPGPP
jgi:hypothetical protein